MVLSCFCLSDLKGGRFELSHLDESEVEANRLSMIRQAELALRRVRKT